MNKSMKLSLGITEIFGIPYQKETKIDESLEPKLQMILDSKTTPVRDKLTRIASTVKDAIKRGEDTRLEDAKPKKDLQERCFFLKAIINTC